MEKKALYELYKAVMVEVPRKAMEETARRAGVTVEAVREAVREVGEETGWG